MSFTQTLAQAQILTNSSVNTISQAYTKVSTSVKATLETKSTNLRSSGFYKNLSDFDYSKLIDFDFSKIITIVPPTSESSLDLVPVASNVSIDSTNSVVSSVFSQFANNGNNSFEELSEILSNKMDRTRENVFRVVQGYLSSLEIANESTIASFTEPNITNDYSECLMVKEFFIMTKCINRDILAEQLVYNDYTVAGFFSFVESFPISSCKQLSSLNYWFMPFVKLVNLNNDGQTKQIDEPLLYEDYLIPRFFPLSRSKPYSELEYNAYTAAMLCSLCHDPINSALMFTNNILDGFAKDIDDSTTEQPFYSNYWFTTFMKLVDLNNDVHAKQIDEPLLYEDYLVPRFFPLSRSKPYSELEYNSYTAAMLWSLCHNPINRVLMFKQNILNDFIAPFEKPTSELPVFEEYWFISFISLVESDLVEDKLNYDSGMIAEYISMRNNPVPGESPYEPLVDEISELIESIVSTTDK